jgi:predicted PurR-regulated permease PerM
MIEEIKKEFTPFKFLVFLLIIAVSMYLLQAFSTVIAGFSDIIFVVILAWLLSFILEPIVTLTVNFLKIAKIWAALMVYLFLGAIIAIMIFILAPLVSSQFQTLSTIVPQYFASFPQFVTTWNNLIGNSVETLISAIPSLANALFDAVLILFLSFYLVIDKERINHEVFRLTPSKWHKNLQFIQKVIDESFASFLQIQLIFGVIAAITTWLVLAVLRIDFSLSVGLLAGLLTIIPLIGPVLALVPAVFVTFVTNPQNPALSIAVLVILLIIQQIMLNYIGPKLMGKAFKLHPIIVLLSIFVAFKISGALGAIFIVPVLGIIVIVIKELGYHFINPEEK